MSKKKIKYLTSGGAIKEIQVEKETDFTVWFDGTSIRINTIENRLWGTWGEAYAYILADAEQDLISARLRLQRAQSKLGNIKGLLKIRKKEGVGKCLN